ncbi:MULTISPECIES: sigma-70 family RNA polymerase sigma factor [Bacillaceae]|uniref:sigma-70 family RNA polymerase sigma factor n=1 Tax=Bacillaceae TaxID=186817 RepID=UPI000BA5205B|nr:MULTISPECIES: sigma-70 family RNA polymerase sigma factor [Bacillaceae]PAE23416.1 RNA polymerase subunit sigma-24 [Bacillus sp. 7894-2]URM33184.1 sigma-70 family RNA polymerase sigma factor [Cytobacillus firmus]
MESFEQLAAQYEPMIHNIMQKLNIYKNTEEFYQLGLITLWQAWKNHNDAKGAFLSYAYSMVKGKMMTELTRQTNQIDRYIYPEADFWEFIEDPSPAPSPELTQELYKKCGLLSENQMKWLHYTLCDELSVREIAEKERVSPSAVKNWRHGAREKLKKIMQLN